MRLEENHERQRCASFAKRLAPYELTDVPVPSSLRACASPKLQLDAARGLVDSCPVSQIDDSVLMQNHCDVGSVGNCADGESSLKQILTLLIYEPSLTAGTNGRPAPLLNVVADEAYSRGRASAGAGGCAAGPSRARSSGECGGPSGTGADVVGRGLGAGGGGPTEDGCGPASSGYAPTSAKAP